jgi:hypothetical protein
MEIRASEPLGETRRNITLLRKVCIIKLSHSRGSLHPYAHASVDPNRTTQFLVAVLAGLQVPFVCSETHELGEELVGSYLYQVHPTGWSPTITAVFYQTTTYKG